MSQDVKIVKTNETPSGKPAGANNANSANVNRGLHRDEKSDDGFKGACPEMEGCIFNVNPVRSVQITHDRKTLDRLKIVTGRECKKAIKIMDVQEALEKEIEEPTPECIDEEKTRMTDGAKIKCNAEMEAHKKKKEKFKSKLTQVHDLTQLGNALIQWHQDSRKCRTSKTVMMKMIQLLHSP